MGHSEYDPAAKEGRPWNAGRMVGAKRALKPSRSGPFGSGSTANAEAERLTSLLFRAGSITPIISAHGNMPGSLMSG
jgi:hypothetical protein